MTFQILNGDSLANSFPSSAIEGELVVCREALIEGNLNGDNLQEFFQIRANYLQVSEDEYLNKTGIEFEKLLAAPAGSEFNLWFEYDLFCQVNMWFISSLLAGLSCSNRIYVVYPSHLERNHPEFWNGFGTARPEELIRSYQNRTLVSAEDLQLAVDLWRAYKIRDHRKLQGLSRIRSNGFPYLPEVVNAEIARFPLKGLGRPERVLKEIIDSGITDFYAVFKKFYERESIYGFGDVQLKRLLSTIA